MRFLKLAFISLIFFIIFLSGLSLFFPSHVRVSKAVEIQASKTEVFDQIANVENWKHWFPGALTAKVIFKNGKAIGVGAENHQQMELQQITDSSITALTKNTGFKDGESGWNFIGNTEQNQITVQWYMDFHLHWYPWEKFSSLLLEKRYGPLLENGLSNLKKYCEK
ncbi:MAG: SRPBCC family protein [Chitinophagaceae bacterium]|nr:SRPBCC family protein [Chitinophagaceae bacterium]MCB0739477.1 SRPBCC family protein [Chitinophagaceae bacterium]